MIVTPPAPESDPRVAAKYAEDLHADGFVYRHTQAMQIDPEVHDLFDAITGSLARSLGIRTYELATLGAARALGSAHCLLAHGRRSLREEVLDEDALAALARGDDSGLSTADAAVVRFAERLSTDAAAMTEADSQSLRDVGFSDREIVDIALAAGARNFFSRTLQALAVPVDDVPGLSPSLVDALLSSTRVSGG
ncbi:MAG: carboxymuconolactone decarboxylase family protein [Microbacterium sp.]